MKNKLIVAVGLLAFPWLSGCLEFEEQTMTFRHDAAQDALYIFQDYRGIFGADDPHKISEGELEQLGSVMSGGRTFFFNNWITEFHRTRLEEMRDTPAGELDDDPAYEAAIRGSVDAALGNVKVENVGFYYDSKRRLCGAQRITVKNVSQVLNALNKLMPFLMREEAGKEDKSAEERRLLRAFAASGREVLQLDGNRLVLRWPVTEEQFRQARDDARNGRGFKSSGGEMSYIDGAIALTIGERDAARTALTLPFSEKNYSDNAVSAAKKHGILESFDAAAAARTFLDENTR